MMQKESAQSVVSGSSYPHPDWAVPGWYRITGPAGNHMAESAQGVNKCGAYIGGYMEVGHPTMTEGEAVRTGYFDDNGNPTLPTNISVINCLQYFVYKLDDTVNGNYGYCGV
jgi:hypothetical protein